MSESYGICGVFCPEIAFCPPINENFPVISLLNREILQRLVRPRLQPPPNSLGSILRAKIRSGSVFPQGKSRELGPPQTSLTAFHVVKLQGRRVEDFQTDWPTFENR